jgi:hypothetical protein
MSCSGSVTSQKTCISTAPGIVTGKFMCSSMTWYLHYWALNLELEALCYCGCGLWNRQERTGHRLSIRNVMTHTDSRRSSQPCAMYCSVFGRHCLRFQETRNDVGKENEEGLCDSSCRLYWLSSNKTSDVTYWTAATCRSLCVLRVLPAVQAALYLAVLPWYYFPRCLAL